MHITCDDNYVELFADYPGELPLLWELMRWIDRDEFYFTAPYDAPVNKLMIIRPGGTMRENYKRVTTHNSDGTLYETRLRKP